MSIEILAIAAMDENRVIGNRGTIPWHIPEDLKHFSFLTSGHTVVMGRKTYDSLAPKYKPLPNRRNMIITRDPEAVEDAAGAEIFTSIDECLAACEKDPALPSDKVWIIGGGEIYRQTVERWDEVYLTLVNGKHPGDAFFPEFESSFDLAERIDRDGFSFLRYTRKI